MNKLMMIGRLTKDIDTNDIHYTSGDNATCICSFSIAVDKTIKNKNNPDAPTADFFRITCFGRTAEFAKDYLKKGTKIAIEGRIENNNYTDANGNKVFRDQIIAERIEFCESKKAQEEHSAAKPAVEEFINAGVGEDLDNNLPWT